MDNLCLGDSLNRINVKPEDVLMIHGDAGVASQYKNIEPKERINHLFEELFKYIGTQGTIIVPTFSYSFTRNKDFIVDTTPSEVGLFSEMFRKIQKVKRTNHPIFSVAVYGRETKKILQSSNKDCFGKGTVFDLLKILNAKIICLGCDLNRITFVHYVEQQANVKYRYNKSFDGQIIEKNKCRKISTDFFVRNLDIQSECDLEWFKAEALAQKKLFQTEFGRFPLLAIGAVNFIDVASQLLEINPHALIKARYL